MCGCPSDQLCKLCLDGRFAQLRGVAACRGERWAAELEDVRDAPKQWPVDSPKMAAIAVRKVEDLARDPMLIAMLAAELVQWAAKRWGDAIRHSRGLDVTATPVRTTYRSRQ